MRFIHLRRQILSRFVALLLILSSSCIAAKEISPSPTTVASSVLPSDLLQSVQIIQRAFSENRPDLLRSLIGNEGVNVSGFAMGAEYRGYNNADEILSTFSDALSKSKPICVGFAPKAGALPDKAILVYEDLALNWSLLDFDDFSGDPPDNVTLQLFLLEDGWRFVYITPFHPDTDLEVIGPLEECPSG